MTTVGQARGARRTQDYRRYGEARGYRLLFAD